VTTTIIANPVNVETKQPQTTPKTVQKFFKIHFACKNKYVAVEKSIFCPLAKTRPLSKTPLLTQYIAPTKDKSLRPFLLLPQFKTMQKPAIITM